TWSQHTRSLGEDALEIGDVAECGQTVDAIEAFGLEGKQLGGGCDTAEPASRVPAQLHRRPQADALILPNVAGYNMMAIFRQKPGCPTAAGADLQYSTGTALPK